MKQLKETSQKEMLLKEVSESVNGNYVQLAQLEVAFPRLVNGHALIPLLPTQDSLHALTPLYTVNTRY